jgi:hypothetical protein
MRIDDNAPTLGRDFRHAPGSSGAYRQLIRDKVAARGYGKTGCKYVIFASAYFYVVARHVPVEAA